jgi:hypothetical protein
MESKFRLQLETYHATMSGHKFALYRSDPRLDCVEDRLSVYVPWVELPKEPPAVIRMTLEWTGNTQQSISGGQ